MPVDRSAVLRFEVESVLVQASGSCAVSLVTMMGEEFLRRSLVQLGADVCAPVWAAQPAGGMSRWEDLRAQLYAVLEAQGEIPAAAESLA